MHEAETFLIGGPWQDYLKELWAVVNPWVKAGLVHPQNYLTRNLVRATSAQRAEAFLRAVGKWKEAPDNQQPITDNSSPTP
jgi:hypothetical protein